MFTKPIVKFYGTFGIPPNSNEEENGSLKKCCLGGINNFPLSEGK